MNIELILSNSLNPAILFFFLGILAVFVKSDLEIPPPIPKLFSLYLLLAIGFKGGVELTASGFSPKVIIAIVAAVVMAAIVPVYCFFILRLKLNDFDAAAIAATYGSISVVTFITAQAFLSELNIEFHGFMVAALALMESPAIIVGLVLVNVFAAKGDRDFSWPEVFKEAFLNSSVVLLVGSLAIGTMTGEKGGASLHPFTQDLFYGVLAFFLLDMGLVAAKRLRDLKKAGVFLIVFSILMPLFNAVLGIVLARLLGMAQGDALLFTVLCASASYIAVPAAMRMTVPQANPSLYVSTALAVTFPFNIIVGIPIYLSGINFLWPAAA